MAKKVNLEDYRLIRKLGEGAFGRVVLAQQTQSQKFYAIKLLAKKTLIRQKLVACIDLEKELMADLSHEFIVNLLGYGKDSKKVFLVMECVKGGDLYGQLKKVKRFPDQQAKFYAAQMVLVLDYLGDKGVLHRDLKPDNFLMCENGYIKACDFGLAKKLKPGKRAYTFCGTPNYMAPEVLLNKGQSVAVDWWSLGVLMYQMLTGHTPWNADDEKELYEKILEGTIHFPAYVDKRAKSLLKHLCIQDISLRYGDLKGGSHDVLDHPWFEDINWDDLEELKIQPPFVPNVTRASDTSNLPLENATSDAEALGKTLCSGLSVIGNADPFTDW